tara:strand:- start:208 stop:369 length:162 start_codon:yes stop_codon:yes gene_type:complete
MDLADYAHTRKKFINKIINPYLQGFSVEEISIKVSEDVERINNVIDCYNYLNN